MGLTKTRTRLDFQSPSGLAPYTEIVTGGLPPYTAASSNVNVATVAQGTSNNLDPNADTLNNYTAGAFTKSTGGPSGANDFEITGTGSAFAPGGDLFSVAINVSQGQYVFSAWLDPTYITAGHALFWVLSTSRTTSYGTLNVSVSPAGRYSVIATIPSGVSQIVLDFSPNTCTVTSGQKLKFSQPMLTVHGVDPSVYQSPTSAWLVTPKYRGSATITYTDSTP